MSDSIESATEYIFENEVPECDYTLVKAPALTRTILLTSSFIGPETEMNPIQARLSSAIRKVRVLNKNKQNKKIRLL